MAELLAAEVYAARLAKVRASMIDHDVDATLLSVGHDLPYLTGYLAMPLERLTLLVVPRDAAARLLIPQLELARVTPQPDVFELLPWGETDDPTELAASLVTGAARIAVGDQMWARFLVEMVPHLPNVEWTRAVEVVGVHRLVKDQAEIEALQAAGAVVDAIAADLQAGNIDLVGRTEAAVAADLSARIIAGGHQKVNFAIVAAGENAASPHHHAGDRIIQENEIVLCDFGGTMNGYCSDLTRCVFTGDVNTAAADIAEAYAVLQEAQAAARAAATVGTACQDVDRAARKVIADAGYGEYFVHRTGHGIGLEEHEDPYIVEGNDMSLVDGHAFSIEPGIYVPGRWGMRLEDIAVANSDGLITCNNADRNLVSLG